MNKAKSVAPKLLSIFSLFWVVLAVNPIYRDIWIAENLILVISLYFLILATPDFILAILHIISFLPFAYYNQLVPIIAMQKYQ